MMEKDIVIIGASGFAKEILFLLERNNEKEKIWNILGYIDNKLTPDMLISGYPIIGNDQWLLEQNGEIYAVCAVGNPILKKRIINKYLVNNKIKFPNIIDNAVISSKYLTMGQGCIICAGSILTVDIILGDFVTINLDCTIGHDTRIADYTTLYPSVNVSGNVVIGELSEIGTGAHIIQGISVNDNVIVGAGSVVIKDIQNRCTVVGNPARVIKE